MKTLALVVLSLQAPASELEAVFPDFKVPALHSFAVGRIAAAPPQDSIPFLIEKLARDPDLAAEEWLRGAAYRALLDIGVTGVGSDARFVDPAQILQVLAGLRDPSPAIQGICIGGAGRVPAAFARELVDGLTPLLTSEDPFVPAAAIDALGRLGPAAARALPSIRPWLVDESAARAETWRRNGRLHPNVDFERLVRTVAAEARMAIGGAAIDLDSYPRLNARGRAAAVDALRNKLLPSLQRGTVEPTFAEALPAAFAYLGRCATDGSLEGQARAASVHLLGLGLSAASAHPDAVAIARATLPDLVRDADARVSRAAALYTR